MTAAYANSINDAGQTAGYAYKYVGGTYTGQRAVLWDANGAALELGNLGSDNSGVTNCTAVSMNNSGQTAGWASTYAGDTYLGDHATY